MIGSHTCPTKGPFLSISAFFHLGPNVSRQVCLLVGGRKCDARVTTGVAEGIGHLPGCGSGVPVPCSTPTSRGNNSSYRPPH